MELNTKITNLLNELEIPYHCKGYENLKAAITLAVENEDLLGAVTKELYPEVARINKTTPIGVERSIRNAIDLSWRKKGTNGATDGKLFHFTYTGRKGRPTNRQFIAISSNAIRNQDQ